MKQICIVAGENSVATHITGVLDFFQFCNTYWQVTNPQGVENLFSCVVVSPDGAPVTTSIGIAIPTEKPEKLNSADAVLIASALAYNDKTILAYRQVMKPLFTALADCHRRQVPIAAFCSGTFLLAATGLLDGGCGTCSWWLADKFREHFPKVDLSFDKLVVQSDNLYTGGATTAYLSLCLKLVGQMVGEQVRVGYGAFHVDGPQPLIANALYDAATTDAPQR